MISLRKGQSLNLDKGLGQVSMGLGWDPATSFLGLLGLGNPAAIDLDASCLLQDASGRLIDAVWFRQLRSRCGAVVHSGDNRTGAGVGDDETIRIDLTRLPAEVQRLVFTVNSFTGQDFAAVAQAGCRLMDDSRLADEGRRQEILRYDLTSRGPHTALIMARLERGPAGWTFHAIGEPGHGRTFQDLLARVA